MKVFNPGVMKTPSAKFSTGLAGIPCAVEIFLGPNASTKVATSGLIQYTSTAGIDTVQLPIVMPAVSAIYKVYVDFYINGELAKGFVGTEDIAIPNIEFGGITW